MGHGDGLGEFRALINKSCFFETERKRPFIYHAVAEEDLAQGDNMMGVMEVNAMLKLADSYFPQEAGLYKKGARFEEKIVLLQFNFPDTAIKALADDIESFELETGWKAEISPECNLGAAEQLIASLLGNKADMKISFYRTEGVFQVTTDSVPADADEVSESFSKITGLSLRFGGKVLQQKPVQADKAMGQMEQNQVFALIDKHFSDTPHRVYKKSLKQRDGLPGIELSFITPNAGRLYESDIDRLMEITRWSMWVNKEANQHELLKAARELLAQRGIAFKKVSFIPERACVSVAFDGGDAHAVDSGAWGDACDEFTKMTGSELNARAVGGPPSG